jgi:hypothetical protein
MAQAPPQTRFRVSASDDFVDLTSRLQQADQSSKSSAQHSATGTHTHTREMLVE